MLRRPQFSVWALAILILGICIGGNFFIQASSKSSSGQPTCNGQVMSPDEVCDVYVNGILDHTDSYNDRVQQAQNSSGGELLGGGVAVICVIILIVMTVSHRRKVAEYEAAVRVQAAQRAQNPTQRPMP
ncbi:MAG TPA: hypothetical protein VH540_21245 [Ktedonobacterales bacterium]|jgi:hypothetical protein